MNPFDLRGPEFLAFYLALAVVVVVWVCVRRIQDERGDPPRIDTTDPYLLAHLRGGANHTLSVAVLALVDRGLLVTAEDGSTLTAKRGAAAIARRPLERAILAHFAAGQPARSIFRDKTLTGATEAYADHLRRLELLPGPETASRRMRRAWIGTAVLLGVAAIKLAVAIQRGRSNVGFLIALTFVAVAATWIVSLPRLTGRGRRVLADLRTLLDGVKQRREAIEPGGASAELPLLAAVFGLAAVPDARFPHVKKLFPKGASGDSSASTGCGSSCGSSGGGGSGCGGGGGGCGGCGS